MSQTWYRAMHRSASRTRDPFALEEKRQFAAPQLVFTPSVCCEDREQFGRPRIVKQLSGALCLYDRLHGIEFTLTLFGLDTDALRTRSFPPTRRHIGEPKSVVSPTPYPRSRERNSCIARLGCSWNRREFGQSSRDFAALAERCDGKSLHPEKRILYGGDDVLEQRLRWILGPHFGYQKLKTRVGVRRTLLHGEIHSILGGKALGSLQLWPQANFEFLRCEQDRKVKIIKVQ